MKEKQISTTARGIAAIRAIESEKPAEERICCDPFARKFTDTSFYLLSKLFAGYGEKVAPGVQGFILCRCRYIDDYLRECLESGTKQLVILGAGLDSRAYRDEVQQSKIKIFEVDHPTTQAHKIERIKKIFGRIPPGVIYIPIDFDNETLDKILANGFDQSLKTLFIWEGVTYYLDAATIDATLSWIRANAAPGSAIIFDYVYVSALTAEHKRGEIKRMQRYQRLTGEELVFGVEKGKIEDFLTVRGFTNAVDVDAEQLRRLYCTGPSQNRKVAEIYAIVHAEIMENRR